VFAGIAFSDLKEHENQNISIELDTIEKYDIENDVWQNIRISKGSLTPCHNLGTFSCFGLHC
jgi:hypothetical protein